MNFKKFRRKQIIRVCFPSVETMGGYWHGTSGGAGRMTRQWLRLSLFCICFVTFISLVGVSKAFSQQKYPDWATRFPAREQYDPDCGPLYNSHQYGPFDYRILSPDERDLVERAHFSYEYDAYLKGEKRTSRPGNPSTPAAGFGYTLWAFPNQVQSLAAMEGLGFQHKTERPPGAKLRVHCYFQRAIRFVPDDAEVRAIYGYYYARRGKPTEARQQLEKAEAMDSSKANVWLYLAFAYLEIKDYDKSLTAAKRAYASGYPLPGLRHRLERAGAWRD